MSLFWLRRAAGGMYPWKNTLSLPEQQKSARTNRFRTEKTLTDLFRTPRNKRSESEKETSGSPNLSASLTVEASLVLPLFLFFVWILWSFFPLLSFHVRLQFAMDEVTGELAQSAYLYQALKEQVVSEEEAESEGVRAAAGLAWKTAARADVIKSLEEEGIPGSVENGSGGIRTGECSWDFQGDLDFRLTYRIVLSPFPGVSWKKKAVARSFRRSFTGASSGETEDGEEDSETVYVTDNGTVYHRSLDCSHLKLTIREISSSSVAAARNKSGAKYYPCERCAAESFHGSTVYIAVTGDRYHVSRDCAGLRRSVHAVRLSEAGSLRGCKDCAS